MSAASARVAPAPAVDPGDRHVPATRRRPTRAARRASRAAAMSAPEPLIFPIRPPADRPHDRLQRMGPRALSTAELLAIVLGDDVPCDSPHSAAAAVLNGAGHSLRRLACASLAVVAAVPGVDQARAVVIHAALELGLRRCAEGREEGTVIRCPRDAAALLELRMAELPVEEFHVLVLDVQGRVRRDLLVTRGLLDQSLVAPREVFRDAIAECAASIIVAHNHPSGDPTPSKEDRDITNQLVSAGRLLDIPVDDHVIVGSNGRYFSFLEKGLI